MIRSWLPRDRAAVLAISADAERQIDGLTTARLGVLQRAGAFARVAVQDGRVEGFLIALRERSPYRHAAFRWFDARFERFLYIDRIVVRARARGQGLGTALYRDMLSHARRRGLPRVVCTADVGRPDPVSTALHARFRFRPVGDLDVQGGRTRLTLLECTLPPARPADGPPLTRTVRRPAGGTA